MKAGDPIDKGLAGLFGRDEFHARHIGPTAADETAMLATLGVSSRADLIDEAVPASLRLPAPIALDAPCDEASALRELADIAAQNEIRRSYIGCGYHGTLTPEPIRRNVLENPGWYTAYTPYLRPRAFRAGSRRCSISSRWRSDLTGLEGPCLVAGRSHRRRRGHGRLPAPQEQERPLPGEHRTHPQDGVIQTVPSSWTSRSLRPTRSRCPPISIRPAWPGAHPDPDTEGRYTTPPPT
ncbi:MAG: hypothetical protein R3E68_21575 [Burkholderiaceae bacterium]